MQYVFILGRNPELSFVEIKSYFKARNQKIKQSKFVKNGLLIEIDNEIDKNLINSLGGTIGIGEILAKGSIREIEKNLERVIICKSSMSKLNYSLWVFEENDESQMISDYLKNRFKEEKIKATKKVLGNFIELQQGGEIRSLSSKNIDEEYVLLDDEKINYFARIVQKTDYKSIENRDMNKPIRRNEFAISPRLAKIMINLAELKKGETMLDGFCGIGVILSEALMQGINVIGIDKDKEAILGAKKNLEFFGFKKENYSLINNDSVKIKIKEVDSFVSEPELGILLKKMQSEKSALEITSKFEILIIKVLNNFKEIVKNKFVFSAPLIQTQNSRIGVNWQKIANFSGLEIKTGFPIKEYRDKKIVSREIGVLEKKKKSN